MITEVETKVCNECGIEKLAGEFYAGGNGAVLSAACKPCTRVRLNRWRAEHPDKAAEQVRRHRAGGYQQSDANKARMRRSSLKKRYAITVEQYNEMLERQGGVCAICEDPETMTMKGTVANLAVDHDPETLRVRGLLCFDCNTGIGKLDHDPDRLRAAISYLTKED